LESEAATSDTDWRQALNPPIYLVSILPGLGVPLLARFPVENAGGLLLATIAVVLLQHAINLFNDAADWRLGADVEKHDSWVRVHGQRPRTLLLHGLLGVLALVLLFSLSVSSVNPRRILIAASLFLAAGLAMVRFVG
jgi:1,4-dihydroxy-2-naphthoate octaprenyltransferase